MKKFLVLLAALILFSVSAESQLWKLRRYEASAGLSTTQFFGDIGGFSKGKNILGLKDFTFRHTRFNINTSVKYRILDDVKARINFAFGYFHSTDVRGSNIERGLESSTMFFEPSIMGEYYFIKSSRDNSFLLTKGQNNPFQSFLSMIDLYAFTGIGGISYNVSPNAKLAPLATSTKGFKPVIPAGVGASFIFSDKLNFGAELSGRYTFSDDIDGYSSKYSKSNDIYYFLTFSVTYKIKTGDNGLPSF